MIKFLSVIIAVILLTGCTLSPTTDTFNLQTASPDIKNGISVYRSGSAQTISAEVWTKVQLNTELYDLSNEFDNTTTYRYTASSNGTYLFVGGVYYNDIDTTRLWAVSVYRNGVSYARARHTLGLAKVEMFQVTGLTYLSVGEYLELYTYFEGTGTSTLYSIQDGTYLMIRRLP